jgi:N-acetylated-alpha-linked acidic dipeptidase
MKSLRSGAALLAATGFFSSVALAAAEGLTGFKSAASDAELAAEKAFDGALDPAEMRAWLQQLAAEPNPVGSDHDKANADFMLAKYKEWGWDARIETFEVLAPSPKSVLLELVAPTAFKAKLAEGAVEGDHTAGAPGTMPAYNAFGADGDVTADLVYANFGLESDFAELERRGIDVKGRSSSPATAPASGGSRPGTRRRTGPSPASSTPTRTRMGTSSATPTPRGPGGRRTASSAARSRTSRSTRATR